MVITVPWDQDALEDLGLIWEVVQVLEIIYFGKIPWNNLQDAVEDALDVAKNISEKEAIFIAAWPYKRMSGQENFFLWRLGCSISSIGHTTPTGHERQTSS